MMSQLCCKYLSFCSGSVNILVVVLMVYFVLGATVLSQPCLLRFVFGDVLLAVLQLRALLQVGVASNFKKMTFSYPSVCLPPITQLLPDVAVTSKAVL